jgi:lipopolysaccharide export system protein LptC
LTGVRRNLLAGLVLAVTAALTWWLAQEDADGPSLSTAPQGGHQIDYYLRRLSFTTYTADGDPARTLRAPELRHFADDDTTEIDLPYMEIHKASAPPWEVRAKTGWISPDGALVRLQGDVVIRREAGPGVRPMRIVTPEMRVEPERDYAETDEPVTVTSRADRIDSVGMQAWLTEPGRIKFLSQVRARYVIPQ